MSLSGDDGCVAQFYEEEIREHVTNIVACAKASEGEDEFLETGMMIRYAMRRS